MSETTVVEEAKQETVIPPNFFDDSNWKSSPTIKEEVVRFDPSIKEKDEKIKEEKPVSDKPNEPEKIPGASPKPIQDRPDETKEKVEPNETKQEAVVEPIKFANEESEKVFNLIKEGKKDEVLAILSEQKKLSEVDKMPPADIIKLNLQYQNKDFSGDDITDLFNERYAMPEKPIQDLESDEEFQSKLEKYEKEVQKVENRIKRDAKPAVTELQKLQKEIVLPDIPVVEKEPVIKEPTQEELDAQKKEAELFMQSVDDLVKNFKGYETTFKDEEVEIKVAYVPSEEDRKEYQPIIALAGTNAGAFLQKIGWLDDKGNLNTDKLLQDVPLILNKEKVFQKIVSETGNKRHEASIKGIKNIDYTGGGKSAPQLGITKEEAQKGLTEAFFI